MKKLFALALVLIVFFVGITSIVPVKASPGVLNVGPGQSFATIEAALAVAVAGDVIHVWNNPSPYIEDVLIGVPNIKIIGQSLDGVTVESVPSPNQVCFVILAPGVTIMGLTIINPLGGSAYAGIAISGAAGASQCKIWNNRILNFDVGIMIEASPNNEVIANEVSGCDIGIFIAAPGSSNNQVRGNELGFTAANGYGVYTHGASWNTITLNNFWASSNVPQAYVTYGDMNYWDSGSSGILKGNWWQDPMGWPPPYMIGEFNLDNYCSAGYYWWANFPWDVTRDAKVDIKDVATAAQAYGAEWSTPKWNPAVDVLHDEKIDIKDIANIAKWFGWSDP